MPILAAEESFRLLSSDTRDEDFQRAQEILRSKANYTDEELIKSWAVIGEYHKWNKESIKCELAYLKCVTIIKSTQSNTLLSECYIDLGDSLYHCNEHEKALGYYKKALSIIKPLGNSNSLSELYSRMANCAADGGFEEDARDYLFQALALPIDDLLKAALLERIALSYTSLDQNELAARYYEDALSIYERKNYKKFWDDRIKDLAKIYIALGDKNAVQRTLNRK